MANQISTNPSLAWFIVQIDALRDKIRIANFCDVDFLHNANTLLTEIARIDVDIYIPTYQYVDTCANVQMLIQVKKQAERIVFLVRRVALEIAMQANDNRAVKEIIVSLKSLSISLSQINKELKSDYYLPLFSFTQYSTEETR